MPVDQQSVQPVLRAMGATRPRPAARIPSAATWKSIGTHLMIPLFLAVGMAFAYLGAFHAPSPSHVPVAIVGTGPQTSVFAQTMNDSADGKLAVRTVADVAQAERS